MDAVTHSLERLAGCFAGRLDKLSDRRFAAVAFLPTVVLVLLFLIPPVLAVFGMSISRIELLRPGTTGIIGTRNFERILADGEFLASVPITVAFAAGSTALSVTLALFSAIVLNRTFRGSSLLGIALLLPWAVAPVVTGVFWKFIFQPQFGVMTVLVNGATSSEGPIPWLSNPTFALGVAVIAATWRSVPLLAIILLAALKTIPRSLYSAARMDGATTSQAFRYVTLPQIRNTLLVVVILQIILSLQVFDIIFTLTGGGPGRATTTMIYFVYETAFQQLSFGYSSALALVLFALILAFSSLLVYLRVRGRRGSATADDAAAEAFASARPPAFSSARSLGSEGRTAVRDAAPRRLQLPPWLGRTAFGLAAIGLVLWTLSPVAWILIASFQPESAVTSIPLALRPEIYLGNYTRLLGDPEWIHSTWVSLQVAVLAAVFTIAIGVIAAYALARLDLPGKGAISVTLILTQMVPAIVLVIPVLLTFKVYLRGLGLYDTVAALVIINVAFSLPIAIWLLRNVLEDVPRSLESAARIDGCSRLGAVFRVLVPAARPGIAAVAIVLLIGTWNEFLFAVVLGEQEAITVTRRIGFIGSRISSIETPPYALSAAAGLLAIAPCIALVALFHRRIMAGLSEGFVKG